MKQLPFPPEMPADARRSLDSKSTRRAVEYACYSRELPPELFTPTGVPLARYLRPGLAARPSLDRIPHSIIP